MPTNPPVAADMPEQVCRKCFNVIDAFMQMCAKGGQCEPSPRDEETAPEPTGHLRPLRICDECGLGKSDSHVCNAEAVKRFASESVERRIEVRMQQPEPSPRDEETAPTMKGLHGKHCAKWIVAELRYCDKPATVCQGRSYRCDEHDPYAPIPAEPSPRDEQRPSGTTIVYPLYFGSESPFRRTYHGRSIVNDYDLIFKRLDSGMVECMGCTEANVKEWYGTPAQAEDHALQHELMGQWFRRLVLNLEAKNEIR